MGLRVRIAGEGVGSRWCSNIAGGSGAEICCVALTLIEFGESLVSVGGGRVGMLTTNSRGEVATTFKMKGEKTLR